MADRAVQIIGAGGGLPTFTAPVSGDTATPGAGRFLWVKTGATGTTATVVAQRACTYGSSSPTHDTVVVIGTSTERLIPITDSTRFGRSSDGKAVVNYSSVATVTDAMVELPAPAI